MNNLQLVQALIKELREQRPLEVEALNKLLEIDQEAKVSVSVVTFAMEEYLKLFDLRIWALTQIEELLTLLEEGKVATTPFMTNREIGNWRLNVADFLDG